MKDVPPDDAAIDPRGRGAPRTAPLLLSLLLSLILHPSLAAPGQLVLLGLIKLPRRLSVMDGFWLWLSHNRCHGVDGPASLPRLGAPGAPHVERRIGIGCADGADTVLYAIVGGGHRLPGGENSVLFRLLGRATPDADAVRMVLDFALPRRIP
jgi:hypothetical protein